LTEADTFLESEIEKLQEKYQQVMNEASEKKRDAKVTYDYSIMKAVMGMRKQAVQKDEL
jgi:hypothetical protein